MNKNDIIDHTMLQNLRTLYNTCHGDIVLEKNMLENDKILDNHVITIGNFLLAKIKDSLPYITYTIKSSNSKKVVVTYEYPSYYDTSEKNLELITYYLAKILGSPIDIVISQEHEYELYGKLTNYVQITIHFCTIYIK